MKIKFNKPTIYVSHPIRGSSGNIEENCKKAAAAARRLRRVFPEVDFYVPAEHDLTLQILTADKRLDIDDIMYADIQILSACHGWMYYHFQESTGSYIEWDKAESLKLLCGLLASDYIFEYDIEKYNYGKLRKDFSQLVVATIKRFKKRNKNGKGYPNKV